MASGPYQAPGLTHHDTVAGPSRATESASRRPADRDLELLARPELRPVRLLLDYWKAELGLADHGALRGGRTTVTLGLPARSPGTQVDVLFCECRRWKE